MANVSFVAFSLPFTSSSSNKSTRAFSSFSSVNSKVILAMLIYAETNSRRQEIASLECFTFHFSHHRIVDFAKAYKFSIFIIASLRYIKRIHANLLHFLFQCKSIHIWTNPNSYRSVSFACILDSLEWRGWGILIFFLRWNSNSTRWL